MSTLQFKSHARVDDLAVGECTIHRASSSGAARWWLLWFNVLRDSDGQPEVFCVPVNPNGSYIENGPGGRTWGLTRLPGTESWQIAPSINVLDSRNAVAGDHPADSLWHQTPVIIGVPPDEPWACGQKP